MGEETRKKVAKEYMEGKWQNDANVDTIKKWVKEFYQPEETKKGKK